MRALLAAERQAGRQRRATHRGQINELSQGRLYHLQPLQGRPDPAAAVADPGVLGGAGPRAQEDRVSGRHAGDVRHPGRLFPVFLAPRSLGEARRSRAAVPSIGSVFAISARFTASPYYWVIDDQSDATFTPMMTTAGPAARHRIPPPVQRRHLLLNSSLGYVDNSAAGLARSPRASSTTTTPGAGASTSTAPRRATMCAISTSARV